MDFSSVSSVHSFIQQTFAESLPCAIRCSSSDDSKLNRTALAGWLSWLVHCPIHQKCCRSDSRSGHVPRFRVPTPVGAPTGDN